MKPQELNNWSKGVYKELYTNWQKWSLESKLIKEKGYALFYSEVKMNPDLMIIGYNPGWNKDFKPENLARQVPSVGYHDYYLESKNDYAMAKKMRSIFSEELEAVLRHSVKLNQLFFNSQNIWQWNREVQPTELRQDIEKYCLEKTYEIIDNLQPKLILTEGFATFNQLIFNTKKKHITISDHYYLNKRIMIESKLDNFPIIAIPHPTGARGISNELWGEIKKRLKGLILDAK